MEDIPSKVQEMVAVFGIKVPTLRNVDKRPSPGFVKAFGYNGYFKSLKEIVHFYNTRDVHGRYEKRCNVPLTGPIPLDRSVGLIPLTILFRR